MGEIGKMLVAEVARQRLYPYPIPPTVRTRTLGFDWDLWTAKGTITAANTTYIPPQGYWVKYVELGDVTGAELQVYVIDTWESFPNAANNVMEYKDIMSDGVLVRIHRIAVADSTYKIVGLRKKAGRI